MTLSILETRDFLRGVTVVEYDSEQSAQLVREIFNNRQVQQDAFVALADCGLELVPLE